jgi:membrane protease YdiL (CAAX protease family)
VSTTTAGPHGSARPRWGLGDVVAGFLLAVFASTLVGAIALGATGDEELDDLPMGVYSLVQAAQWIGFLGIPLLVARFKGNGPARDFGTRMERRDVPIGLALGVGLQLIVVPLVSLPWVWLLGRDWDEIDDRAKELTDRSHGWGLLALTLVVVAGAPLVEEIFFRGLTLRSFERRLGRWGGLAASAFVFGATHFDLLSLPALVVFGLVAGRLVQRAGRLGPAWWTHVGFNATTIVALVAQR